jgi:hypothetical protein
MSEAMMGRLYDKFLNFLIDKKLYNETWYYYLTGEWRVNFPEELKHWQTFLDSQRKLYSLLPRDPHYGDAVNVASCIESHGFGGAVQITRATYELIKDEFVCEPRGTVDVEGKGEMEVWLVVSGKQNR